ncbi:hypothetical protein HJ158_08150 [Vibrio parahaemolyticus]|nr:hypothetical protein [Vibrio parahaemolyticus]
MTEQKFDTATAIKMIATDGVCPLNYPFQYNGVMLTGAIRVCRAKTCHRVEAEAYCKDNYRNMVIPDVIMAYLSSTIVEFGVLTDKREVVADDTEAPESKELIDVDSDLTEPSYTLTQRVKVPVDILMNQLDYVDMVTLQYLLGKS